MINLVKSLKSFSSKQKIHVEKTPKTLAKFYKKMANLKVLESN